MPNEEPFSNLGPDPFLPFIPNYEEQYHSVDQDPWTNAQFGFAGLQNLSFMNGNGFDTLNCITNMLPDAQLLYLNQDPPHNHLPSEQPIPRSTSSETRTKEANTSASRSPAPATKRRNNKRAVSSTSDTAELDEEALIIEKRRRNTIASARFRVKKKEREAELERRATEMTKKAEALEKKVEDLEKQVSWLRSLLLEKAKD